MSDTRVISRVSSTPKSQKKCKAQYLFNATTPSQISVVAGEELIVLDDKNKDWTLVQNIGGKKGYVPAAYVKIFEVILEPEVKKEDPKVQDVKTQTVDSPQMSIMKKRSLGSVIRINPNTSEPINKTPTPGTPQPGPLVKKDEDKEVETLVKSNSTTNLNVSQQTSRPQSPNRGSVVLTPILDDKRNNTPSPKPDPKPEEIPKPVAKPKKKKEDLDWLSFLEEGPKSSGDKGKYAL